MNTGVPECPECGGKGMCDLHKLEYLKWIHETARDEYYDAFVEYRLKLGTKIEERNKND